MFVLRYLLIFFDFFLLINIKTVCRTNEISTSTESLIEKAIAELRQLDSDLRRDEEQLKFDQRKLDDEKRIFQYFDKTDLIQLNIGGEIFTTTRETLTSVPKSLLSSLFNGRWEQQLPRDRNGYVFFDFNPLLFRHLLDQLQLSNSKKISPPSDPLLLPSFEKMIKKLNLQDFLLEKNLLTLNVNGQRMTSQRSIFEQIWNSTMNNIIFLSNQSKLIDKSDVFIDYHPKFFRHFIKLRREKKVFKIKCQSNSFSKKEEFLFKQMLKNWSISCLIQPNVSITTKWNRNAITVAGGNGSGQGLNQLCYPYGIDVDDGQTIYIADWGCHRIVEWKKGTTQGQIVAGGNGQGNRTDQLNRPINVIVDHDNDTLIIADLGNRRVMQWSRRNDQNSQILVSNIGCHGLALGNNGHLYVSDVEKDEVRRWKIGENESILVAGGNGKGDRSNQFNQPRHIFLDENESIYVSDNGNHRVMKWIKGAKEGIIVAGGQGQGNSLTQLAYPRGIFVDKLDTVYIADFWNHRIVRWMQGSREGEIVVGGNGQGNQTNQLSHPIDLSFDEENNLYVVENENNRVQKFSLV